MTNFQIISLLPAILGYIVLSWKAWKDRNEYGSGYIALWVSVTFFLAILLPTIAFTIK